ncbi:hypothetical protein DVH24_018079 [Malus domestica]|uniref:RNase H type-1 domain-containing protein n=1 Tax=Malus domestica TaxID=3750 RepID=A0A498KF87_MALDO|nr:hypothetical protein DVH24_018079 [Malus domestica]
MSMLFFVQIRSVGVSVWFFVTKPVAMLEAAQRHWRVVILESNALQVVQALHSPHCGVSATGLLIEDVKASLQSFATVKVNHICTSTNVVTHSMAKLAFSSTVPSLWFEVPPVITIQDALLHDCILH